MPEPRITTDPEQCGGAPCVRGMRVRVSDVLDLLRLAGMTPAEVCAELPYLTPADVEACQRYAREIDAHPEHRQHYP